jgi:plasmid stabilization system protein ParE
MPRRAGWFPSRTQAQRFGPNIAFEVLITDEALADLDLLTEFIRASGSVDTARKWFAGMYAAIESLTEMPARCPLASEAEELGSEVRLLLHGRKNRAFKIYYAIDHETPSTGTVRVFHVRHWARKPVSEDELQDLLDDLTDEASLE